MLHWAYCENLQGDEIIVADSEAHHLINVLRCRVGDHVTLFDGHGTVVVAKVISMTRRDLRCFVLSSTVHVRPIRPRFTVIASPPKADRLKWMVEKLTEVGVDQLILLNTARTVTTPGESRLDKIHSNMIAACKQCRRPFFMELSPLQSLESVLTDLTNSAANPTICIAHPDGSNSVLKSTERSPGTNPTAVLIGPEGGFTDEEVDQAVAAGAVTISWPNTILRIETAAVVFSTLLLSRAFEHDRPDSAC